MGITQCASYAKSKSKNSRLMFSVVIGTVLLMLLSSCSPVYRVKYDYKIADDDKSKLCVSQCNQIRQSCNQNENLNYQLCRLTGDDLSRANHAHWHHQQSHAHHSDHKRSHADSDHAHSHHGSASLEVFHHNHFYHRNHFFYNNNDVNNYAQFCDVNYDSCTEAYNACFQSCGGEVSSQVYCAQNCEDADIIK